MSVAEKKEITVAEARKLLMDKAEELDPLQRRVLEYTIRFSKLDSETAKQLTDELVNDADIDRGLAVQIVNAMPGSIPEIRTFLISTRRPPHRRHMACIESRKSTRSTPTS